LVFLSDFLWVHIYIKKYIYINNKKTLQNSISPWDAITGETTWRSLGSFTLIKHGLSQDSNQQMMTRDDNKSRLVQILEDKDIIHQIPRRRRRRRRRNSIKKGSLPIFLLVFLVWDWGVWNGHAEIQRLEHV